MEAKGQRQTRRSEIPEIFHAVIAVITSACNYARYLPESFKSLRACVPAMDRGNCARPLFCSVRYAAQKQNSGGHMAQIMNP
jgi:hypothetical protein